MKKKKFFTLLKIIRLLNVVKAIIVLITIVSTLYTLYKHDNYNFSTIIFYIVCLLILFLIEKFEEGLIFKISNL